MIRPNMTQTIALDQPDEGEGDEDRLAKGTREFAIPAEFVL